MLLFRINSVMNIIFIDDEKYILELVKKLFKMLKIEVECYGNGLYGIEAIRKKQYDFIFIDFNMPELNLGDIIDEVMEIKGEAEIYIVSGEDREYMGIDFDNSPELNFLKKPFTIDQIREIVD